MKYFRRHWVRLLSASFKSTLQPAAQHCVGADGTEVIGGSSSLSAAAQLHRYVAATPLNGIMALYD